jgi:hypothetical protein
MHRASRVTTAAAIAACVWGAVVWAAPLVAVASPRGASPAVVAPSAGASRSPSSGLAPRGVTGITAAQLRDYLTFIASDDLEGRDTPSRGLDITARFLATELARAGAEPGGDNGTFFQTIALTNRRVDAAKTTASMNGRAYRYGTDFLAGAGGAGRGAGALTPGMAAGPMVYVGHGYVVKAKNLDAYKGLDVTGKILIAQSGLPSGVSRQDVRGTSSEWDSPVTYAAKHGAKGVIFIPTFETLAGWDGARERAAERGSTTMDAPASGSTAGSVPAITASAEMLQAIFEDEKLAAREIFRRAQANEPADAFALDASKQMTFTVEATARAVNTQNVVAIVRGSDPVLKDEYVALGAHYDHVGLGTGDGDIIFNGADDDGSGTTAILTIAETLAKLTPRPKRSFVFVWHAGEEHGLWGSKYFTDHPTVPMDHIVAQLNIDMIGRSRPANEKAGVNTDLTGPDETYVIGSKMMSSTLADVSEHVNASFLKLKFNYKYDDPSDPNRFFFRSDHYNYARKGVPIIFYFSGVHADYHRVSDSVDKIDFEKMEKITRTVYATALTLADTPARPKVDRSLPHELTEQ